MKSRFRYQQSPITLSDITSPSVPDAEADVPISRFFMNPGKTVQCWLQGVVNLEMYNRESNFIISDLVQQFFMYFYIFAQISQNTGSFLLNWICLTYWWIYVFLVNQFNSIIHGLMHSPILDFVKNNVSRSPFPTKISALKLGVFVKVRIMKRRQ